MTFITAERLLLNISQLPISMHFVIYHFLAHNFAYLCLQKKQKTKKIFSNYIENFCITHRRRCSVDCGAGCRPTNRT